MNNNNNNNNQENNVNQLNSSNIVNNQNNLNNNVEPKLNSSEQYINTHQSFINNNQIGQNSSNYIPNQITNQTNMQQSTPIYTQQPTASNDNSSSSNDSSNGNMMISIALIAVIAIVIVVFIVNPFKNKNNSNDIGTKENAQYAYQVLNGSFIQLDKITWTSDVSTLKYSNGLSAKIYLKKDIDNSKIFVCNENINGKTLCIATFSDNNNDFNSIAADLKKECEKIKQESGSNTKLVSRNDFASCIDSTESYACNVSLDGYSGCSDMDSFHNSYVYRDGRVEFH